MRESEDITTKTNMSVSLNVRHIKVDEIMFIDNKSKTND